MSSVEKFKNLVEELRGKSYEIVALYECGPIDDVRVLSLRETENVKKDPQFPLLPYVIRKVDEYSLKRRIKMEATISIPIRARMIHLQISGNPVILKVEGNSCFINYYNLPKEELEKLSERIKNLGYKPCVEDDPSIINVEVSIPQLFE
ncbi:MAG: hypothetical protein QXU74_02325 [Candidatus Aenigmatarchaeota archaeon]